MFDKLHSNKRGEINYFMHIHCFNREDIVTSKKNHKLLKSN